MRTVELEIPKNKNEKCFEMILSTIAWFYF